MRVLVILSVFFFQGVFAQSEVEFTAKARKTAIWVNDTITVTFSANVDFDKFSPPDFKGFSIERGPSQVASQVWIGGKTTFWKTYKYKLKADKNGSFKIGKASMEYLGNPYFTDAIVIQVSEVKPIIAKKPGANVENDVVIKLETSATTVKKSDTLFVSYRIFFPTTIGVDAFSVDEVFRDFEVFSVKSEISEPMEMDGFSQRTTILKRIGLLPKKTGELIVDSQVFDLDIEKATGAKNSFGLDVTKKETVKIATEPIKIKVEP
ncbi:BatD family protein [Flavobacterium sp.]|uniref:BatD family protein n=1 Tax=Flavobacterium sp. TaxID=239 RepID=UPI0025BC45E5|nr:BatD family protein [Flavobacterium sp.]